MHTLGRKKKRLALCIWTSYLKQLIKLAEIQISTSWCLEPGCIINLIIYERTICCDLAIFARTVLTPIRGHLNTAHKARTVKKTRIRTGGANDAAWGPTQAPVARAPGS